MNFLNIAGLGALAALVTSSWGNIKGFIDRMITLLIVTDIVQTHPNLYSGIIRDPSNIIDRRSKRRVFVINNDRIDKKDLTRKTVSRDIDFALVFRKILVVNLKRREFNNRRKENQT